MRLTFHPQVNSVILLFEERLGPGRGLAIPAERHKVFVRHVEHSGSRRDSDLNAIAEALVVNK
jgi:hypothetical protein